MPEVQTDWRRVLTARLAELDARLHGLDAELDSRQDADWVERATERENDEVLEGLGRSGESEARQIRAALGRLDAGTFGICLRCGDAISDDRLAVVPHAPLCATCAGGRAARPSSRGRRG